MDTVSAFFRSPARSAPSELGSCRAATQFPRRAMADVKPDISAEVMTVTLRVGVRALALRSM
jgi:hypothetical protein